MNKTNPYFCDVIAQEEYKEKGRFLYGESMGGAVALLLHKKDPSFWNGALLVAPMCKVTFLLLFINEPLQLIKLRHKSISFRYNLIISIFISCVCEQISEKVKPHPVVINLLTRVEDIIPKWKIVPTKDVIDAAFKDPIKREEVY